MFLSPLRTVACVLLRLAYQRTSNNETTKQQDGALPTSRIVIIDCCCAGTSVNRHSQASAGANKIHYNSCIELFADIVVAVDYGNLECVTKNKRMPEPTQEDGAIRKKGRGAYFSLLSLTLIILMGYISRRHSLTMVKDISRQRLLAYSTANKNKQSMRSRETTATGP